ncbi:GNAT family N-acetyltransferase [Polynucleobacter sp. CS-Odin-A6]|uniref:GNAT family N-acetyltransferase n=1 Tax=Polynucleobacter sp. CS-Odin-A6 TaxID=2689106 RepID=UPI001C0C5679|nr:GNAT family N-acetyltransferase [Polynucleobacter sp. CS-Odin-A6]MBU3621410.1 GNAT family N-acetyltransferase [Polynucleobacter sp. CS-Odin-A6]
MHNKAANSRFISKTPYASSLIVHVRELHANHKEQILNHLLLLNEDDRRLRFGTQTSNEVIERHVERLDFTQDKVFGHFDALLNLAGIAHLAYLPIANEQSEAAEFGVSVLPNGRGQGIGTALLARASVHARNTGVKTLFVHCLANNKTMMHIARKAGMHVELAYGDADAHLRLLPANHSTIVEEATNSQWANFDYVVKANWKRTKDAWCWILGKPLPSST